MLHPDARISATMQVKIQSHPGERWTVSCCALNKRDGRSLTSPESASAVTQAQRTPQALAWSSRAKAICGLVWKETSSGTWALARRDRSSAQCRGRYSLDVHFATCSSVLIDLDYSGSLWERGSSCTKITLGPQERGCSPCRCLSRTLFVCPIHSVPNLRP